MKTYICVAHAGGQGKTTVAQALYRVLRQRGEAYKLYAADFCDDLGRSKLGKFFPGKVTELGIGASLVSAKAENDPNAALKYWDRFGEILVEGGGVIDIGANVISPLKQWAQHRNAHRVLSTRNAAPVEMLLVCKAEKHAIQDVAELIKTIHDRQFVPANGVTVVLNEVGGGFEKIDVRKVVAEVAPAAFVRYVRLPRCTSELWARMEQTFTTVDKALGMREEELAQQLDLDMWSVSAGLADLKSWIAEVDGEFKRYFEPTKKADSIVSTIAGKEERPDLSKMGAAMAEKLQPSKPELAIPDIAKSDAEKTEQAAVAA